MSEAARPRRRSGPEGRGLLPRIAPALLALAVLWTGGSARAELLYGMTLTGNGPGQTARLIRIDRSTAVASVVGFTGIDGAQDLVRDDLGRLLTVGFLNGSPPTQFNILASVDPNTGLATRIGKTSPDIWSVEGLAFDKSTHTLYGSADYNMATFDEAQTLVKIDTTTGAATKIGEFGSRFTNVDAIAFSPTGVLYGAHDGKDPNRMLLDNPALFTIDPTTGKGTLVAELPTNMIVIGMRFAPDGTLFATTISSNESTGPSTLVKINPTTGAITPVGVIGPNINDLVTGIEFPVAVPEPGSLALMSIGGVALLAFACRGRR